MRRVLAVGGLLLVVCVLAAIGWAGWTMWSAEQHLRAAQAHLEDARSAIQGLDSEAAASAAEAAKVESGAAADLAQRRIWSAAAALPKVGDTPEAARALVLAADAAVTGVAGLATAARALAADDLFVDGQVDLAAVSAAGAAATGAGESLALATERLAAMPTAASGGWVIGPVEDARAELSAQLDELIPATDGLSQAGDPAAGPARRRRAEAVLRGRPGAQRDPGDRRAGGHLGRAGGRGRPDLGRGRGLQRGPAQPRRDAEPRSMRTTSPGTATTRPCSST